MLHPDHLAKCERTWLDAHTERFGFFPLLRVPRDVQTCWVGRESICVPLKSLCMGRPTKWRGAPAYALQVRETTDGSILTWVWHFPEGINGKSVDVQDMDFLGAILMRGFLKAYPWGEITKREHQLFDSLAEYKDLI